MTFDAFEGSLESGTPVELYVITIGALTFRYTSAQTDYVVDAPNPIAGTYSAVPISRGPISQSAGEQSEDKLEVTLPADNEYVSRYVSVAPGFNATFSLYQTHRDDPDAETILLYQGIVAGVSFQQDVREAIIQIPSLLRATTRSVPRRTFQAPCNHMLYDGLCTLLESNFEFNFEVTAASSNVITVPGAGAVQIGAVAAGDAFVAGFVESADGDFRLVEGQGGSGNDDLTLLLPFATSPVGTTVRCVAGCQHRIVDDCERKFDNADNFGGFPTVPRTNLFRQGIGLDVYKKLDLS